MHAVRTRTLSGPRYRSVGVGLLPALLPIAFGWGCGRSLTIHQDPYINTAVHADRAQKTGDPLELTVVCVYPEDLNKPANAALKPDNRQLTSKDWYERRPLRGATGGSRFDLPESQIFLFTDDASLYGTPCGARLRGSAHDGDKPITRGGIKFDGGWSGARFHDPRSVIYVFAKFTDKDGNVLPVAPAVFHPPGAYTEKLEVKIGVDANQKRLEDAQYIRVLSERKLHGKEDSR